MHVFLCASIYVHLCSAAIWRDCDYVVLFAINGLHRCWITSSSVLQLQAKLNVSQYLML